MEGGKGRGVVAAIVVTTCMVTWGVFASGASGASQPLAWLPGVTIDQQADSADLSVSCASPRRCVAVDDLGNVVTSTHPTGGAAAWSDANLGDYRFNAVSCPGKSLCVAVDDAGDAVTSTDPTGGSATWQVAAIDPGNRLSDVSCSPQSFCFAIDAGGNVLATEDPTAGSGAWTITHIATGGPDDSLQGISCPNAGFCAVVDDAGRVYWSGNPAHDPPVWDSAAVDGADGLAHISCATGLMCVAAAAFENVFVSPRVVPWSAGTWTMRHIDYYGPLLTGISCPSAGLCVTVDASGNAIASSNPAGGALSWRSKHIDRNALTGVSCVANPFCVAVDSAGHAFIGTEAPPGTVITDSRIRSGRRTATFSFRAVGGGAVSVAQCSLRRPHFSPCGSPKTYRNLRPGRYAFAVRAVSRAGPDPTPATRRFRIRR